MRSIGQLDHADSARRFADFLYLQGIAVEVEPEDDGTAAIWVQDDAHLASAKSWLERFRDQPDEAQFTAAPAAAERQRSAEDEAERGRRSTVADAERVIYERSHGGQPILAYVLIGVCAAVALYSNAGADPAALAPLHISNFWSRGVLPLEVRAGQVWRLITPIFIHLGWLHLFFNMWWLKDLGGFVQDRFSVGYLAALILAAAIISNLTQYWWDGPAFGGMSGVNYALFGFLWIRGKYDRRTSWSLHPTTVQTMLLWFAICLSGLLGPVANAAHFGGLAVGSAWGWLSSGRIHFSR